MVFLWFSYGFPYLSTKNSPLTRVQAIKELALGDPIEWLPDSSWKALKKGGHGIYHLVI